MEEERHDSGGLMLDKTDVNVCARFSGRFVEVDEILARESSMRLRWKIILMEANNNSIEKILIGY